MDGMMVTSVEDKLSHMEVVDCSSSSDTSGVLIGSIT